MRERERVGEREGEEGEKDGRGRERSVREKRRVKAIEGEKRKQRLRIAKGNDRRTKEAHSRLLPLSSLLKAFWDLAMFGPEAPANDSPPSPAKNLAAMCLMSCGPLPLMVREKQGQRESGERDR